MRFKLRLIIYNVALPLIFGALIYLCFRSNSLIMFNWFDFFHLNFVTSFFRENFYTYNAILPDWFKFSLPDALWIYALNSTLYIIWDKKFIGINPWFIIALFIAPFHEFLQLLNIVPGTFDVIDLIFYFFGSFLSILIVKLQLKKNEKISFQISGINPFNWRISCFSIW